MISSLLHLRSATSGLLHLDQIYAGGGGKASMPLPLQYANAMMHNCTTHVVHMCILRSYICDEISDCSDQSDEPDCDYVR